MASEKQWVKDWAGRPAGEMGPSPPWGQPLTMPHTVGATLICRTEHPPTEFKAEEGSRGEGQAPQWVGSPQVWGGGEEAASDSSAQAWSAWPLLPGLLGLCPTPPSAAPWGRLPGSAEGPTQTACF